MKKLLGFFLAVFILVSPALAAGGNTAVYITRTGECYHTGSCRYLKKSKIEITLADAVARGYRACKVCCPPSLDGEERQGHAFAGSGQADSTPSPSPSASPTPTANACLHSDTGSNAGAGPCGQGVRRGKRAVLGRRRCGRYGGRLHAFRRCQTPVWQGGEKEIKSNKMAGCKRIRPFL